MVNSGNTGILRVAFGEDGTEPYQCISVKDGKTAIRTRLHISALELGRREYQSEIYSERHLSMHILTHTFCIDLTGGITKKNGKHLFPTHELSL